MPPPEPAVLYAGAAKEEAPFLEGTLVAEDNGGKNGAPRARVQPATGEAPLWLPRSSVFLKSPPAGGAPSPPPRPPPLSRCVHPRCASPLSPLRARAAGPGVRDNAQLFYLDEANLLHNLTVRFGADAIYTYTGTVLLAVNPYKTIKDLYDEGLMDGYRGRALGVLPPHVYAMAERARRAVVTEGADQSIVRARAPPRRACFRPRARTRRLRPLAPH